MSTDDDRREQYIRRIVVFVISIIAVLLIVGFIWLIHTDVSRVPPMRAQQSSTTIVNGVEGYKTENHHDNVSATNNVSNNSKDAGSTLHRERVPQANAYNPARPLSDEQRKTIAEKAKETAAASGKTQHQFTYCVTSTGDVGDISEFERTVYITLNDSRGWPRAGVTFTPIADTDSCDMTFVLAQAHMMKSFSQDCSVQYSCRVGNNVIINEDRWNEATDSWNQASGSLADYRTMVINHETGHRLGHNDNETVCAASGEPAPLMQQQSMSLRGCTFNEWPLDSELWVR